MTGACPRAATDAERAAWARQRRARITDLSERLAMLDRAGPIHSILAAGIGRRLLDIEHATADLRGLLAATMPEKR